jgi:hypothetical protein
MTSWFSDARFIVAGSGDRQNDEHLRKSIANTEISTEKRSGSFQEILI